MKSLCVAVNLSLWSAGIAVSTGCGSSAEQGVAPSAPAPNPLSVRATRASSWMKPDVPNADLLYVSDANGEVTVYRYWQRTLVGILTKFTQPMGMCVNSGGDVFVADYAAQKVYEYAHGGTKAIAAFDEAPLSPYACAVDLTTGNLAVANLSSTSSVQGDIAIYTHASGTPAIYTDAKLKNFDGCAYDSDGNLLVTDGRYGPRSGGSSFAWLPNGGSKLLDVNVPGPEPSWRWNDVQGIQWDGKYFVLDEYSELYRVSLIKGQAYYIGDTYVSKPGNGPYWIYNANPKKQGTQVVAGAGSGSSGEVYYWDYPAGGDPIHYVSHGVDEPFGVTISLKNH